MAGQARIFFFPWVWTTAPLSDSPPLRGYDVASLGGDAGLVGWRVIGANNRELGRCAHPAASVIEAYQVVREAQQAFGRPVARVLLDAVTGWSWHISLDGERIAVSSRGYQRQRECDYSLVTFRELFPLAKVAPPTHRPRTTRRGPLTIRPFPGVVGRWDVVAIPSGDVTT